MNRETIDNILNFLKEKEGKELPKKWFDSIEKLKLIYELENHPDGIQYRYEGDLNLNNTMISKLPNDLYVGLWLDLLNCKHLTKLPDKLHVGRSLYLEDCKQLTKLPDNLYVGYHLFLNAVGITEIPNNLYVEGDFVISSTPLAKKYTDEEIYEIVTSTGGEIIGKIYR